MSDRLLASVAARRCNLPQAADLLKKAIEAEADPDFVAFHHCELAFVYKAQTEFSLAAGHFEEALRLFGSEVSQGYKSQIAEELRACRGKSIVERQKIDSEKGGAG